MLDDDIKAQLKKIFLQNLQNPVELAASLDDRSEELKTMLSDIAELSDKIVLRLDGNDRWRPSFSIGLPGRKPRIRFVGVPFGHEFSSLVLALLQISGHPPKIEEDLAEQIRAIPGPLDFETFISLECHNCPDVVQALNLMATLNPGITHTLIDGALFKEEIDRRQIMAVPTMYLNGRDFGQGRMALQEIVAKVDVNASAREAAKVSGKAPFDVLVVGGGPAGSSAAIYAARKGLRVGVVAERFGGQVLDTNAIENLISIKKITGTRLGMDMEEHVRGYGIDVTTHQRAVGLSAGADGLNEIRLDSGAVLRGKSIILAMGAHWRELGVPGEKEYRARGVAYCPHCDGPLFRGKRVAVVGGGNSGAEAAIDLAGVVGHVTLLVRSGLRADAVLREKLRKLENVTVVNQAVPAEIFGDRDKVNGLLYTDRISNETRKIDIEGIFVQIGLAPNTAWLKNVIALSPSGEIEIDSRGQTSMPGIFAAGDCTTVPYKQIIVALGEGAKASLAASEYLLKKPV
ncbi:MAG: alkyl hydroperoxide reductase subunit F [Candidatus Accumulibacter sp.]|jgi:alkyl hydroperoxide reductase subunit F|nr:alkyl hydroperoxide reductase subunit F [Accumulibacter sp.]